MSANDELQAHTCEKMLEFYGNVKEDNTFCNEKREENHTFCKVNVANNVAQSEMQDLTEQYKNGKLKRGLYWVVVDADGDRSIQPCVYGSEFDDFEEVADEDLSFITTGNITQREHFSICWEEVLAPVPSYDDWVYLHKARNDAHEIVESLTQENKQLRKWCEEFNALDVAKENQQLKELLKECREIFSRTPYTHKFDMVAKIDNAIGEKK